MVTNKKSPGRASRLSSPFSVAEAKFVIQCYNDVKSITSVRRAFRNQFYKHQPDKVPKILSFRRLIDRFENEHAVRPQVPQGRLKTTEKQVKQVVSMQVLVNI